ncbi:MAG: hypothetical protein ABI778_04400 [Ignavibacteriota bacterium]
MRTQITKADWRKLKGILLIAKIYSSTLFIFWVLGFFPVMPLMMTVSVVVAMILILEAMVYPISKAIRNSYEIISPDTEQTEMFLRTRKMEEAPL